MDAKAYHYLRISEKSWWYRGREAIVKRLLSNVPFSHSGRVLDFGAGYGAMYTLLKRYGAVDACEIEPSAIEACRTRGYVHVITDKNELKSTDAYDLIGAFDVLEHVEDDRAMFRVIYELLNPGGIFVATVPAFNFLWSAHDELHHHFKRYSLPEIKQLYLETGFIDVRATYWNVTLFPIAYLLRRVGYAGVEALVPRTPVNWLLSKFLTLESNIAKFVTLPFGMGIAVIGKKPLPVK